MDKLRYQFVQFHMERERERDLHGRHRGGSSTGTRLLEKEEGGHESATRCLKLKLRSPFPSSPRDASLETQRSGRGWP